MRHLDALYDLNAVDQVVLYAGINDTILNASRSSRSPRTRAADARARRRGERPLHRAHREPYQRLVGPRRVGTSARSHARARRARRFYNVSVLERFADDMFGLDRLRLNARGNAAMRAQIMAALAAEDELHCDALYCCARPPSAPRIARVRSCTDARAARRGRDDAVSERWLPGLGAPTQSQ